MIDFFQTVEWEVIHLDFTGVLRSIDILIYCSLIKYLGVAVIFRSSFHTYPYIGDCYEKISSIYIFISKCTATL